MAIFDQRGQSVTYQYNAAGNINLGGAQNRIDLVAELENLHSELSNAIQHNVFDEESAIKADSNLKLAIVEAKKQESNKQTILDRLTNVKTVIEGVTSAAGMVTAIMTAIELVRKFF